MSTFDRSPEDETWYVHAPLKNEKRPLVNAPPPSNIPYLNGVADDPKEINKPQQVWFKETDSDFIKLSKLGGREDLLVHRTREKPCGPKPYPLPAWWIDMMTEMKKPNEKEKEPYVFQVPAWFAHQDKVKSSSVNDLNKQHINQKNAQYAKNFDYSRYEGIQEPLKYGQIRNYLHPVNVRKNDSAYDRPVNYTPGKAHESGDDNNMHKIMGNYYASERPENYEAWRAQQELLKRARK